MSFRVSLQTYPTRAITSPPYLTLVDTEVIMGSDILFGGDSSASISSPLD